MKNNISLLSPKNPKPLPSDIIILLSDTLWIINLGLCQIYNLCRTKQKVMTNNLERVNTPRYGSIYNIHAFNNLLLGEI